MKYGNPFEAMAEMLRSLRQRFVGELQDSQLLSLPVGEVLGGLALLINDCEMLRADLERLDPWALAALERAIGGMAAGKGWKRR